ncbi:unnamed protein product, partial [Polarella glacialis]
VSLGAPGSCSETLEQVGAYNSWIQALEARSQKEHLRVVCLDVGTDGVSESAAVRQELESVLLRFPSAVLIRVSPEDLQVSAALSGRCISLAMGASQALNQLQELLTARSAAHPPCRFVVRDHDGMVLEVSAPRKSSALRVLHLLERSGVGVNYGPLQEPRDPPR